MPATFRRLLVQRTLAHGSRTDMRLLSALRDREFRLARLTLALALVAAMVFALIPGFMPPAMAMAGLAPAGFIAVCSADGVTYVPAGDYLPPGAEPGGEHAVRCLHCCPAHATAVMPDPPVPAFSFRWKISVTEIAAASADGRPVERALPRGPPSA